MKVTENGNIIFENGSVYKIADLLPIRQWDLPAIEVYHNQKAGHTNVGNFLIEFTENGEKWSHGFHTEDERDTAWQQILKHL